jgi:hypothetical protein
VTLSYYRGTDFDASQEVHDLIKSLGAASVVASEELRCAIDMAMSLLESERGFTGIKDRWARSGSPEIFLYLRSNIIAAARVPGDGRSETRDLGFLGTKHFSPGSCADRGCPPRGIGVCSDATCSTKEVFMSSMNDRIRTGVQNGWPRP